MDLENIREELRRLSALIAGWSAEEGISALERDLALEKLRALYDAVRFGGDSSAAQTAGESAPEAVAVNFDLGGILSLAPESGTEAEMEPIPEVFAPAVSGSDPEEVSEPEPAPEPEPEPESAPEPEEEPESVFEEFSVESIPASAPGPVAESVAELAPAPQPVEGSLFGLEEEALRHRRKQRVIMSLYDTEALAPKPAREAWPAPVAEPAAAVAEQSAAAPETEISEMSETPVSAVQPEASVPPEPVAAFEPEPEPEPEPESAAAEPESELESEPESVSDEPETVSAVSAPVLGEVINHDVQTLSDTIIPQRDVASELRRREPITDLSRAIGINDKFLLIRDLFAGDGEAYDEAIRAFNAFDELDDCMIYIAEHYAWNPNSDGAKLLMELLERKYA